IISTILSIDQRTSLLGYYSRFNGGLLSSICYAVLYWAFVSNIGKKQSLKAIRYILISASLVAVFGILEHFGGSISCVIVSGKFNDDCWVQDVKTRVFASLGQPNWLAAFLASLAPLTWYFSLQEKLTKKRIIWITLTILLFACVIFTKSRSGLLGLGIAYIIFWIFNFKKNLKVFIIISSLLFFAIALFGTPFTPSLIELAEKKSTNQSTNQINNSSEGGTESGEIRKIVWKGAINIWKAYPLFGTGVETFGYSYWQFRPIEHNNTSEWDYLYNKAHNEYLNFLANSGAVGLGTYMILIGTIIFILRKNKSLLSGFVSILVTNFFGFSVVNISLLTFLFPAFAIAISSNQKNKITKTKNLSGEQKISIAVAGFLAGISLFLISRYWYADFLYQKSNQDYQSGLYEDSVKNIQDAINLSPNEAIFHNQMAKILTGITLALNEKDSTDAAKLVPYAINESDIALALSPRNMNIRESRMNILSQLYPFNSQYLDLEIQLAKDTILLSPTDPKIELILGKALANSGRIQESIEAINKALELKHDYKEAQKALEVVENIKTK